MDKYVGKKLDGRYEIRELIGIGGMANVYRCYDTIDDREVAIKILKDEYLNNEEFIRRFKNESKAIAVLSHPNIVKVYDVSFGDMIQYIVMEYIDGITLKEYINQQKVLTWKETVHLVTQILKALSHAHSKGVVHRDIKPQNMMLLSDGTIKVTDFGIARFSNSTRTMTEQAIGSVHYIAPEQAKGDITDGKTDIYSIGVMMYEMLTGKLPFDGDNAVSVALMHLQVVPDTPRTLNPSIPEGIEEITLKAMQKQPGDRYQSAQDMLDDIERFRMNPSVRFEYKYLYDKQPTKYVDAVSKGKSHRAEEFAQSNKPSEDEKVRHSLTVPIIVGILIALCISLIVCIPLGAFRNSQITEAPDVEVPNFVGKTVQEINENTDYQFRFEYDYVYSEEHELGIILDQQPKAGSKKIKANGSITLSVNSAQSDQSIPAIYGTNIASAMATLNQEGFYRIEVIKVSDSSAEDDSVVRSYPQQGSVVSLNETIYLYVAAGEADSRKVSVPNTIGYTKADAITKIESLGFECIVEPIESTKAKDTVVTQSPLGGELKSGSAVTIYVSALSPENSVTISVDLPQNITHSMQFTVAVEGVSPQTVTVYPGVATHNFSVTGRDYTTVRVLLDDQLYREYRVNFTEKTYEVVAQNEYVDTGLEQVEPTMTPGEAQ
ncbi:MAG: Stk1 family PASTA domain-containing Ser/Thr kinase [Ruminococcus sp.]|nr:Stk1 family PASTA domain-containing Ser/Thr kinase [Ruminococcus sp.]